MRALVILTLWLVAAPGIAATIEGRVVHAESGEVPAGTVVSILGLRAGSESIDRKTETRADGRFRFADVPSDAAYLVGAHFDGVTFPAQSVIFDSKDPGGDDQVREVTIEVHNRSSNTSTITLDRVRWIVRHEAGVYRVEQTATVTNSGARVVVTPDDDPAPVQVGLASGHGDLEAPFGAFPTGVAAQDGVLVLRGPFFPGERNYQIAYDMSEPGAAATFELAVPTATQSLELYVRDSGVAIDAPPLHPARIARDGSDVYQAFVGFSLPAGSNVAVQIEPLAPVRSLPRPALVGLVSVVAGLLCFLVVRPISLGGTQKVVAREARGTVEREALVAGLRDLEHDFETGKISGEDRDRLRDEMRREALQALTASQATARARRSKQRDERCSCGQLLRQSDRFCSGCGKPL